MNRSLKSNQKFHNEYCVKTQPKKPLITTIIASQIPKSFAKTHIRHLSINILQQTTHRDSQFQFQSELQIDTTERQDILLKKLQEVELRRITEHNQRKFDDRQKIKGTRTIEINNDFLMKKRQHIKSTLQVKAVSNFKKIVDENQRSNLDHSSTDPNTKFQALKKFIEIEKMKTCNNKIIQKQHLTYIDQKKQESIKNNNQNESNTNLIQPTLEKKKPDNHVNIMNPHQIKHSSQENSQKSLSSQSDQQKQNTQKLNQCFIQSQQSFSSSMNDKKKQLYPPPPQKIDISKILTSQEGSMIQETTKTTTQETTKTTTIIQNKNIYQPQQSKQKKNVIPATKNGKISNESQQSQIITNQRLTSEKEQSFQQEEDFEAEEIQENLQKVEGYLDLIDRIGQYLSKTKSAYSGIKYGWQITTFYVYKKFAYERTRFLDCLTEENKNCFSIKNYEISNQMLKKIRTHQSIEDLINDLQEEQHQIQQTLVICYQKARQSNKNQKINFRGDENPYKDARTHLANQYKMLNQMLSSNLKNEKMIRRKIYVMQLMMVLESLQGRYIKQYQQEQEIQNPIDYLKRWDEVIKALIK